MYNNEIRKLAFKHLQKCGYYVRIRQNFKGKKKSYQIETDSFIGTPQNLYNELMKSGSVQNMKKYDVFVSHSSLDKVVVRKIVDTVNHEGLNCYIDWTADDDFLKRTMVSEYTKEVLKIRMSQADELLYISTHNSRKSPWVKFELEYFQKIIGRKILMIIIDGTDEHNYAEISIDNIEL